MGINFPTFHPDDIFGRVHFGSQFGYDFIVNGDQAVLNKLFRFSSRGDPRVGDGLL
jgi:hypothetical protein